ncbi:chorismate-binding protein [Bizionia sediminis]|uniref:Chorismate-binding protein n=1 Tax=Bizionia sediminis TaxID=1737064 RepID=A0ABW5KQ53_9FLAO
MTFSVFFEEIQNQFAQNLPLVAYKMGQEAPIKAFLQENDRLYKTSSFEESGFVLAPFNLEQGSILIPSMHAKMLTTSAVNPDLSRDANIALKNTLENPSAREKEAHIELIKKGITAIQNKEFTKVVLSRQELQTVNKNSALDIFTWLLQSYPSAFVYIWFHPKVGLWLGATPETLLQIENKTFKTMSLAGTQTYKNTNSITWGAKELDEQNIVTKFITAQLAPYLTNLTVSDTETIRAGNLLHLKTLITGELSNMQTNLKNIIAALHPTPAVCGLPKEAAKTFINSQENYDREFYTGFLGELHVKKIQSRNTNRRNVENNAYAHIKTVSNLFVNLRCMQIKDKTALIYVGGGITQDSNPDKEWEETVAKSATMKKVL